MHFKKETFKKGGNIITIKKQSKRKNDQVDFSEKKFKKGKVEEEEGGEEEEEEEQRGNKKEDYGSDVIFFEHFTCKFVRESQKNFYFIIDVLGQKDFRFYKSKMQQLINSLHQCLIACDQQDQNNLKEEAEIFESVVDTSSDDQFQSRLVANVWFGKINIFYRTFIWSEENNDWLPSKRAIKFKYDHEELEKLVDFVNKKLLQLKK